MLVFGSDQLLLDQEGTILLRRGFMAGRCSWFLLPIVPSRLPQGICRGKELPGLRVLGPRLPSRQYSMGIALQKDTPICSNKVSLSPLQHIQATWLMIIDSKLSGRQQAFLPGTPPRPSLWKGFLFESGLGPVRLPSIEIRPETSTVPAAHPRHPEQHFRLPVMGTFFQLIGSAQRCHHLERLSCMTPSLIRLGNNKPFCHLMC